MNSKVVLDGPDIARTIVRIAHQVVEQTEGRDIAIVGIHRRGAVLARRLAAQVSELVGQEIPLGELDISFYRDDVAMRDCAQPVVHASEFDFDLSGWTLVVLVDDVLSTGRTGARGDRGDLRLRPPAAGPARGPLADRGHRGCRSARRRRQESTTSRAERVNVPLEETDGASMRATTSECGGKRGREAADGGARPREGRAMAPCVFSVAELARSESEPSSTGESFAEVSGRRRSRRSRRCADEPSLNLF